MAVADGGGGPRLTEVEGQRNLFFRLLELGHHDRVEPFLEEALVLLVQTAGARRAAIRIWDRGLGDEAPAFSLERGLDDADNMAFSQSVIAEAFETGETIVAASALEDPRFHERGSVRAKRLEAVLCVPIGRNPIDGVLYLQDRIEPGPFSDGDRQLAEMFARHLSAFVERLVLRRRNDRQTDATIELRKQLKAEAVIGRSDAVATLLRQVALSAPLPRLNLLIGGPGGSGKTQIARIIHDNSPVAGGPFVEVNCGAIPAELVENELFGAKPGAHATAARPVPGKVAAAEGGTLFLDEIGDLPWRAQASLLQLLQSRTYFPLGSATACRSNARIIAATNIDLEAAIVEHRFREDLYHRLNVFQIRVPGLAERKGDLELLATAACKRACEAFGFAAVELSPGALRAIETASWPGEIRELINKVEGACIRAHGEGSAVVERKHLFPEAAQAPREADEPETFHGATRRFQEGLVRQALEAEDDNASAAARRLGITRAHLYNLMATFGIRRDRSRRSEG